MDMQMAGILALLCAAPFVLYFLLIVLPQRVGISGETLSAVEKEERKQKYLARSRAIALGLLLLFVSTVSLYLGLAPVSKSIQSQSWPHTSGRVLDTSLTRQWRTRRLGWPNYTVVIQYHYTVDRQSHTRCNLKWLHGCANQFEYENDAKGFAARFPVNKKVRVTYNPDDPSDAALEPGVDPAMIGVVGFGLAVAAVALLVFVYAWRLKPFFVIGGPSYTTAPRSSTIVSSNIPVSAASFEEVIRRLLEAPEQHFVIFTYEEASKTVEFMGPPEEGSGLTLDIPFVTLGKEETQHVRSWLEKRGLVIQNSGVSFYAILDEDAGQAAGITLDIFEEVFRLPIDAEVAVHFERA